MNLINNAKTRCLFISTLLLTLIPLGCGGPRHTWVRAADGIARTNSESLIEEGFVTVETTGVQMWYQRSGPLDRPTVILLNGSDFPAIMWHQVFVDTLLEAGFHVVRFDPRDCGLSERLPWPEDFTALKWTPEDPPPYPLTAMEEDLVGLMDALEIEAAHLIGVSMGGMVAQLTALDHPARVRTLTLLSTSPSNSFDPELENPTDEQLETTVDLFKKAGMAYYMSSSDGWMERLAAALQAVTGSSDGGVDLRAMLREIEERDGYNFESSHGFAIATAPSRVERLSSIETPTLVMHGSADPWFPYSHAKKLAELIPAAKLVTIEGEGHAMPRAMYNPHVDRIIEHLRNVEEAAVVDGRAEDTAAPPSSTP